jgi:AcrR family transcriptional regulator
MSTPTAILEKAEHLFMRYGVKSVSMDDVAREMGISKKTLYQYFSTKEELIIETLQYNQKCELTTIGAIRAKASNALEEMVEIARMIIRQLQQMSPSLIFDLKKYHPEAWKVMEAMERTHIYGILRENLENGIKQGLYRSEFNPDILARIYLTSINVVIDDQLFPPETYPTDQVFREYIHHYLRGIVSPTGAQFLEKYMRI